MILYHGSSHKIDGPLKPVLLKSTADHTHQHPTVFATDRQDVASLFMFPLEILASIGFEEDIAYICVWGTPKEISKRGQIKGYLYLLSAKGFQKVGKDYEWQSFEEVLPVETKVFGSVIEGMMEMGVQVYFIDSDLIFDQIVADENHRAPILKRLVSENQKSGKNTKQFN